MDKSPNTETDLKKRIAAACVGLVLISETDSPVEPFFGKRPSQTRAVEIDLEKFFDRLTAEKDWHTATHRKNAKGFAALKALLEDELSDIHVYRVGKIQVDYLVIGLTTDGMNAGVQMKAIET